MVERTLAARAASISAARSQRLQLSGIQNGDDVLGNLQGLVIGDFHLNIKMKSGRFELTDIVFNWEADDIEAVAAPEPPTLFLLLQAQRREEPAHRMGLRHRAEDRRRPPQRSHTSTSKPNTRWSSRAQGQRRGARVSTSTRESGGDGVGTMAALQRDRGPRSPW